jgi:hypothetical protein
MTAMILTTQMNVIINRGIFRAEFLTTPTTKLHKKFSRA